MEEQPPQGRSLSKEVKMGLAMLVGVGTIAVVSELATGVYAIGYSHGVHDVIQYENLQRREHNHDGAVPPFVRRNPAHVRTNEIGLYL